jgi:hypothetical protein
LAEVAAVSSFIGEYDQGPADQVLQEARGVFADRTEREWLLWGELLMPGLKQKVEEEKAEQAAKEAADKAAKEAAERVAKDAADKAAKDAADAGKVAVGQVGPEARHETQEREPPQVQTEGAGRRGGRKRGAPLLFAPVDGQVSISLLFVFTDLFLENSATSARKRGGSKGGSNVS